MAPRSKTFHLGQKLTDETAPDVEAADDGLEGLGVGSPMLAELLDRGTVATELQLLEL